MCNNVVINNYSYFLFSHSPLHDLQTGVQGSSYRRHEHCRISQLLLQPAMLQVFQSIPNFWQIIPVRWPTGASINSPPLTWRRYFHFTVVSRATPDLASLIRSFLDLLQEWHVDVDGRVLTDRPPLQNRFLLRLLMSVQILLQLYIKMTNSSSFFTTSSARSNRSLAKYLNAAVGPRKIEGHSLFIVDD